MKPETLQLLAQLQSQSRIEFTDTGTDLAINYDLTDNELRELVELEYGKTSQSLEELFKCLCKKAVKLALELK